MTDDMSDEVEGLTIPDEIVLDDGRRLTRAQRDADGKPREGSVEIGFANLGAAPRVRLIPTPRVLAERSDLAGKLSEVVVAYPKLKLIAHGAQIEVPDRGWYRILNVVQTSKQGFVDIQPNEVVMTLMVEPLD